MVFPHPRRRPLVMRQPFINCPSSPGWLLFLLSVFAPPFSAFTSVSLCHDIQSVIAQMAVESDLSSAHSGFLNVTLAMTIWVPWKFWPKIYYWSKSHENLPLSAPGAVNRVRQVPGKQNRISVHRVVNQCLENKYHNWSFTFNSWPPVKLSKQNVVKQRKNCVGIVGM